jgi:CheY-like chemotaxis protein
VPVVSAQLDPKRRPVLVVEDNAETLFIYEKYLKGSGYQVIPARTLQAARAALARFRPVAVILDVLLEGENTWGLLNELKGTEATRDIPVLVVTMVENEAKARALGADAFCVKPVDRTWLLSKLGSIGASPPIAQALVIEDDDASRYLIRGLLVSLNFSVIEAKNGSDGLRLARLELPQLIALDLELPDTTGLEVMQHLRAEPSTQPIPIIINTSRVLEERDRHEMLAAGAAAVLNKESLTGDAGQLSLRAALREVGFDVATGK